MLRSISAKMKKRKGLSLLELGIWALAVAVFMGIAMPRLGDYLEGKKRNAADQETRILAEQCALYTSHAANGQPPASLGALAVGISAAQSVDGEAHNDYLAKLSFTSDPNSFVDPWRNPYQYDPSNRIITSTANGGTPITHTF